MSRTTIRRTPVVLGVAAGIISATVTPAAAVNHPESVLYRP